MLDLKAATLVRGREHADTTLVIDHRVPRCTSREHYKAVLDGEAHAVFQGKVIVQPGAQKTDGKQMAQALMLSETAEFSSKPELEIYADDVACGHGSTSTELNEEHLFYLKARGVPDREARRLLTEAFIAEPIEAVEDEALREALRARVVAWLEAGKAEA
jgi:Fe-S cluster assembly protein SufD